MRKGFTLIELMVVIAIMGILASVGVPKLTTAIAKSKASEVPVAASVYIKLQDAYVIERKQVGSWKRIGYAAPKSNTFNYVRGGLKKLTDQAENLGTGWTAISQVPLADCLAGNMWTVDVISHGKEGDRIRLEYKSEVTSNDCSVLMSGWGSADGERTLASNTRPETPVVPSSPSTPETPVETSSESGSDPSPVVTSSASSDPVVEQYKACGAASGGGSNWIHGAKNGWEKDSEKSKCLALRKSLYESGILVCKNGSSIDNCNNFEFNSPESECQYTGNKCK